MLRKLSTVFVLFVLLGSIVKAQQTSMTSPGGGGTGGAPSFPLLGSGGLVGAPTYSFSASPTIGMWNRANSAQVLSFSSNGKDVLELNDSIPEAIIPSNYLFCWSNTVDSAANAQDTCLVRISAGVFGGSTSTATWFQNSVGESALAGNYTNATAGFTSTNLTRTLVSGQTYNFDAYLYITESTAADGWQINFNANALGITNFVVNCSSSAETGIAVVLANGTSAALATVINATSTVTTGGQEIECHGSIVPSASGVFGIQAAQNTHSTGTLTLKRGSGLIVRNSPAL